MPTRSCAVCRVIKKYSKEEYRYLDKDGDLVCSLNCVLDWLYLGKGDLSVDIRDISNSVKYGRKGIVKLNNLDRRDVVYSSFLKKSFMSNFEMYVMEVFSAMGQELRYEPYCFLWGTKSYTPDFFFELSNSFLEVKGMWQTGNRNKYKLFRKMWPEIRMLVVPWILFREFKDKRKELLGI